MLKTIDRKPDEAEERRRAEAAAAIERRLGLGAATAPKPAADPKSARKEPATTAQPTWVKMNGGRFGRRFIPAPERIFSRKEVRWAVLAAGAYLIAAAAMGLFSTFQHQPAITPATPPAKLQPGEVRATDLPQLPADTANAG